jgi:hypothetical protein
MRMRLIVLTKQQRRPHRSYKRMRNFDPLNSLPNTTDTEKKQIVQQYMTHVLKRPPPPQPQPSQRIDDDQHQHQYDSTTEMKHILDRIDFWIKIPWNHPSMPSTGHMCTMYLVGTYWNDITIRSMRHDVYETYGMVSFSFYQSYGRQMRAL